VEFVVFIFFFLYVLSVAKFGRKIFRRLELWALFPVIIVPAFLAGALVGYARWYEKPEFWAWFFVIGTLFVLTLGILSEGKGKQKDQPVRSQPAQSNKDERRGINFFPEDLTVPEDKKLVEAEVKPTTSKKTVDRETLIKLAKEITQVVTKERLREKVVGQDFALELIDTTLKSSALELQAGNRKREKIFSSFLLVGATGVGKTETAKTVAKLLEDLGYSFTRVDLNQFRDEHSIWTLLGSPRGYKGSEKGGYLTNALKENPKRVILFDEVEKAHPDVMSFLLQFLDEGYVVERESGERYEAQMGIIFFTSNFLAHEIGEIAARSDLPDTEKELLIRQRLENFFRPEFVGRIDEVVPYRPLDFYDLLEIARRELSKLSVKADPYELTLKYEGLAQRYGVRMFLKKIIKESVTSNTK